MIKYGTILYNCLTEEPSMVLFKLWGLTLVRRPVMGTKGIHYKFGLFLNPELETLQEQTARTIANIQSRQAIAGMEFDPASLPTSTKSN